MQLRVPKSYGDENSTQLEFVEQNSWAVLYADCDFLWE